VSKDDTIIGLVKLPAEQYLACNLPAARLVQIVDQLVADDRLHGLDAGQSLLVGQLHEALALYVPDEPTRRLEPGIYIGEEELRRSVEAFLAGLKAPDQMDPKE